MRKIKIGMTKNTRFSNGSHPQPGGKKGLEKTDLIVDKMHLHHGMKADNPVSRLRFFGKYGDENQIAQRIPEKVYHTILPRCFEERAIRVFCRKPVKEKKVKEAFEAWCKKRNVQLCDHELSAVSAASSD